MEYVLPVSPHYTCNHTFYLTKWFLSKIKYFTVHLGGTSKQNMSSTLSLYIIFIDALCECQKEHVTNNIVVITHHLCQTLSQIQILKILNLYKDNALNKNNIPNLRSTEICLMITVDIYTCIWLTNSRSYYSCFGRYWLHNKKLTSYKAIMIELLAVVSRRTYSSSYTTMTWRHTLKFAYCKLTFAKAFTRCSKAFRNIGKYLS